MHLQILAAIARMAADRDKREALLKSQNADQIHQLLRGYFSAAPNASNPDASSPDISPCR